MFTVIVIVVIVLIILGSMGNNSNSTNNYGQSNQYSQHSDYSNTGNHTYSTTQSSLYHVQGGVIKDIRVNKTKTGHYQYWLTVATSRGRVDFSKFIETNADVDLYTSLRKGDVVNFTYIVSKGQYLDIQNLKKVGHRLFG